MGIKEIQFKGIMMVLQAEITLPEVVKFHKNGRGVTIWLVSKLIPKKTKS